MAPTANDDNDVQIDTSSQERPGPLSRVFGRVANVVKNWRKITNAIKQASANANTPEGAPEEWSHSTLLRAYKSAVSQNALLTHELDNVRQERDDAIKTSMTCPLTGSLNRTGLGYTLNKLTSGFLRNHGNPAHHQEAIVVVNMDVDNLKRVNDSEGHDAGDRFLIDFNNRLTKTLRPSDYVAHPSGDEYNAVIVTDDPEHTIERLRSFQTSLDLEKIKNNKTPTASFGFSVLTHERLDSLVEYGRKASGNQGLLARHIDPKSVYRLLMKEADIDMFKNKAVRKMGRDFEPSLTSSPAPGANAA